MPTPVPEPATWVMMLLGFAAVGFAMRRRPQLALRTA
ncbi:MAG: PEPxxWA-CTERM sorting domain-containing protein [Pseudomonadota bacterium]